MSLGLIISYRPLVLLRMWPWKSWPPEQRPDYRRAWQCISTVSLCNGARGPQELTGTVHYSPTVPEGRGHLPPTVPLFPQGREPHGIIKGGETVINSVWSPRANFTVMTLGTITVSKVPLLSLPSNHIPFCSLGDRWRPFLK